MITGDLCLRRFLEEERRSLSSRRLHCISSSSTSMSPTETVREDDARGVIGRTYVLAPLLESPSAEVFDAGLAALKGVISAAFFPAGGFFCVFGGTFVQSLSETGQAVFVCPHTEQWEHLTFVENQEYLGAWKLLSKVVFLVKLRPSRIALASLRTKNNGGLRKVTCALSVSIFGAFVGKEGLASRTSLSWSHLIIFDAQSIRFFLVVSRESATTNS